MKTLNDIVQLASEATLANDNPPKKFRSIFISDLHLGTKDSKASQLNEFLKHYTCERLYMVGDIFDGWKMKNGIYWHKSFNKLIRRILKLAKQGTQVYYVTGNHDEFLRKWANTRFDNIQLLNRYTHITAKQQKLLVIHGDQFEGVTHCSAFLKHIGDVGYMFLMFLNRCFNLFRARYGLGYWSLSGYLKNHIKRANKYISNYEQAVAQGARNLGFDGVVCGHIHQAADKHINGTRYMNTGDWVESCTAIAEDHSGELVLIHWLEDPKYLEQLQQKNHKIKLAKQRKRKSQQPA